MENKKQDGKVQDNLNPDIVRMAFGGNTLACHNVTTGVKPVIEFASTPASNSDRWVNFARRDQKTS